MALIALWSVPTLAEDALIAQRFAQRSIDGTIVIVSLQSGQTFIHNDVRAHQKFTPASTFKIPNTLIALEEKAVSGKDALIQWDGHLYDFPAWNRDQTLESAFKVSCVWYFQALARQIGLERYKSYLSRLGYGTLHDPAEATTFWLDGSLEISAIEQVEFLKKVYQRVFPFSAPSYDTLQAIMMVEKTPHFTLRAKTGWGRNVGSSVGWYVGSIETLKDVWFFATNLVIRDEKDLPLRQDITREALQAKGIIE